MLLAGAGCSDRAATPFGSRHENVETDYLGVYYELAFAPAPSLAKVRASFPDAGSDELLSAFARELALQGEPYWASGSISVPLLDGVDGPPLRAPAPADSAIRASCGATLIAPSLVITAGHCVTPDSDLTKLRLQMYRPGPRLVESYGAAAELGGTWPNFTHPPLGEADGYFVDEYPCAIVSRCYSGFDSNCPAPGPDVALLECEGSPGAKYGFINVFSGDPTGSEALMHWKHEVYELASPPPQAVVDHYLLYPSSFEQNYHYFESGGRLLPLRSARWSNGEVTRFLSSIWTDVHGCHGSSGSGVLARIDGTPEYRLVAPVARAGASFSDSSGRGYLCQQSGNPTAPIGPGTQALGLDWPNPSTMLTAWADRLKTDCRDRPLTHGDIDDLPFRAGTQRVSTVFTHLDCRLADYATSGSERLHPEGLSPYPEKYLDEAVASEHVITGFSLESAADYRLGIHVLPRESCAADCGSVTLRAGASQASFGVTFAGPEQIAHLFAAANAGSVEIGLSSAGPRRALGALVLIREGQINSFDALEDRLEAALYPLATQAAAPPRPLPMRFVGDGRAGFQALLQPGERMGLLRQALAAGHRWTVRLGATSYDGLYCGLLDMSGAPTARVPCSGVFQLDDRNGTSGRLGFYVELDAIASGSEAAIRYVALASDRARDDDGDGIPEVLDNCPGDWNASQAECSEEPPPDAGSDGGGSAGTGSGAVDAGNDGRGEDARAPVDGGAGSSGAAGASVAASPSPADSSGCGCRSSGAGRVSPALMLALLTALRGAGARRGRRAG